MAKETEIARAIENAANELEVDPAAIAAIAEIETGMRVFTAVNGRREPPIRFEAHYFDRRLSGTARERARADGLAAPGAGAIANPNSQAARWRLLERAAAIDRKAAFESTSWGVGQVMGAHWSWLGFGSVDALVGQARAGADGQFALMARYIGKAGLAPALRTRDWAAFARGYNGPGYRRNAYDSKLAAAFERQLANLGSNLPAAKEVLRRGARGAGVGALQRTLNAHGHDLVEDGVFGPRTQAAVRRFQRRQGLAVDGIVGPRTRAALLADVDGRKGASFLASLLYRFLHELGKRIAGTI